MLKRLSQTVIFILSTLLILPLAVASEPSEQIEEILRLKEAPEGVVFEIVTGESNSLEWALPETKNYIKELRTRFPKLEVAIVTHGSEQFALKKTNNKKHKKIHSFTQQLVEKDNIPLHVCGTYAGWKGLTDEDFPEFVDVAAAGPATINDYISLGYILIKL